jgi:hypothetical protein
MLTIAEQASIPGPWACLINRDYPRGAFVDHIRRVLAPTYAAFGLAFPAGHRSPDQAKAEPAGEGTLEVAVDVGGVAGLGVDVDPLADRS